MDSAMFRALAADDGPLLRVATLGNINWLGDRFTMHDVQTRPEFARYTRLEVERGDFGFAAVLGGQDLGVAWALFLPRDDAGYGFVDGQTPEFSLWVCSGERGRGLGRALLHLTQAEARRRGVEALSLSVEAGNPAQKLYLREGFIDVPGREDDGAMRWVADTE